MNSITYKDKSYPALQSQGFAAQYAFQFAKEFCKGEGVDVGYCKPEWKYPGAIGIDFKRIHHKTENKEGIFENITATNFNEWNNLDYIFSSHCLEHIEGRFQDAVEYWISKVKPKGIVFLYLPNCDYQKYWAWGNKKHVHYLNPAIMQEFCEHLQSENMIADFFVTLGHDLNGSFYTVIER